MKRLLWVGDAVVPTGFAKVGHNVLAHLQDLWEIYILGINYMGDPHRYPYTIYPACRAVDQDMWGFRRFAHIVNKVKPDVICILQDPWNVFRFLKVAEEEGIETPICAYIPVDAYNIRSEWCMELNRLHTAIFYTQFGKEVIESGGFNGNSMVIPHGVDLEVFSPVDKTVSRETLGMGKLKDAFLVGNVGQNQVRKRLDLTIRYFYLWLQKYQIKDAWLYIHAKSRGVIDLIQLGDYYERILDIKPRGRMVILGEKITQSGGIAEQYMKTVYSCMDVHISTAGGEGWGLCTMESMACGVPQIIPDFGSLAEWAGAASLSVPCTMTETWEFNTIGQLAGESQYVEALQELYADAKKREFLATCGRNLVSRPFYRWENIAKRFHEILSQASTAKPPQNRVMKKEEPPYGV